MARLLTTGAEWNDTTAEGVTPGSGSAVVSSANPRTGNFHFRNTANATGYSFNFTGVSGTTYLARNYVSYGGLPSSGAVGPIRFLDAGLTYSINVRVFADGSVDLFAGGVIIGSPLPAGSITSGSYNLYEIAVTIGVGSVDYCEARLNGVSFASGSGLSISDNVPAILQFGGFVIGNVSVDVDDVALNDSTGAAQNSWPGDGKIVLLKPVSDNAKGTGWTNDAAATTNLFDAVDNRPPVGIADTTASTGLHQLRNATSNANSNYDANLTTYTAAGIGATDTINVLVPMAATAAPVTTSSKQGTLGVVSNPTIANVALSATGTAGAFWSGVAAGTYPTGWKWSSGTTTYAPSVTPGTAPVARITQVTSSTRIAMVCALGMYVDYTPAVAATTAPPFQSRTARNFLLRR